MMGKPVPEEQRANLLRAYKAGDRETVKALLKEYGLHEDAAARIARQAGYYARGVVSEIRQSRAAMWARARANGALVR